MNRAIVGFFLLLIVALAVAMALYDCEGPKELPHIEWGPVATLTLRPYTPPPTLTPLPATPTSTPIPLPTRTPTPTPFSGWRGFDVSGRMIGQRLPELPPQCEESSWACLGQTWIYYEEGQPNESKVIQGPSMEQVSSVALKLSGGFLVVILTGLTVVFWKPVRGVVEMMKQLSLLSNPEEVDYWESALEGLLTKNENKTLVRRLTQFREQKGQLPWEETLSLLATENLVLLKELNIACKRQEGGHQT